MAFTAIWTWESGGEITITDVDCQFEEDGEEPVQTFSEGEIAEAIENKALTEDMAWYLHTCGVNWQVDLK